jgi:hypothetical protein
MEKYQVVLEPTSSSVVLAYLLCIIFAILVPWSPCSLCVTDFSKFLGKLFLLSIVLIGCIKHILSQKTNDD